MLPDSTRMIRLVPSEENDEIFRCELIEVPIQNLGHGSADYCALSHCWSTEPRPMAITIEGHNFNVPQHIYDAFHVARKLAIGLIWVDFICIDQTSEVEWRHQASRMATIYRQAIWTIVCTPSRQAAYAKNQAPETPTGLWSAAEALQKSPWMSRAWVSDDKQSQAT